MQGCRLLFIPLNNACFFAYSAFACLHSGACLFRFFCVCLFAFRRLLVSFFLRPLVCIPALVCSFPAFASLAFLRPLYSLFRRPLIRISTFALLFFSAPAYSHFSVCFIRFFCARFHRKQRLVRYVFQFPEVMNEVHIARIGAGIKLVP